MFIRLNFKHVQILIASGYLRSTLSTRRQSSLLDIYVELYARAESHLSWVFTINITHAQIVTTPGYLRSTLRTRR